MHGVCLVIILPLAPAVSYLPITHVTAYSVIFYTKPDLGKNSGQLLYMFNYYYSLVRVN